MMFSEKNIVNGYHKELLMPYLDELLKELVLYSNTIDIWLSHYYVEMFKMFLLFGDNLSQN